MAEVAVPQVLQDTKPATLDRLPETHIVLPAVASAQTKVVLPAATGKIPVASTVPGPVPAPGGTIMETVRAIAGKPAEQRVAPATFSQPYKPVVSRLFVESPQVLTTVEFALGKFTITPSFQARLKMAADLVRKDPLLFLKIAGHTDNIGRQSYNYRLSQKRAQFVKKYIVSGFAVEPAKIIAKGYGHYQPISDNGTIQGRRKNRRVEIFVMKRESEKGS